MGDTNDQSGTGRAVVRGEQSAPMLASSRAALQKRPSKGKATIVSSADLAEQMLKLKLDNWRQRAEVVFVTGQRDGTALLSIPSRSDGTPTALLLFDGFKSTWRVPCDDWSPLLPTEKAVAEELSARRVRLQELLDDESHKVILRQALRILMLEASRECRNEWAAVRNANGVAAKTWEEVQPHLLPMQIVEMIARNRLVRGDVALPGYLHINVLDLDSEGDMTVATQYIPPNVDLELFLAKLEEWDPQDGARDIELLNTVRGKVEYVAQFGTTADRTAAAGYQAQLDKPHFATPGQAGSERDTWAFKVLAHGKFVVRGKGPAQPRSWKKLDRESFASMLETARGGKFPVLVRLWKVRLRRMWHDIEDLAKRTDAQIQQWVDGVDV